MRLVTRLLLLLLLALNSHDLAFELVELESNLSDDLGRDYALLDRLWRRMLHRELDELAVRLSDEGEGA